MAGVVLAGALPGDGERLARVAAAEDVDGRGVGPELADVGVDRDVGEPSLEDASGVAVVFAGPGEFCSEVLFDGKIKAADSAEEGSDPHVTIAPEAVDSRGDFQNL